MKVRILILIAIAFNYSCTETDSQYLGKVCSNLLQLSSVQYTTIQDVHMDGELVSQNSAVVSLDFKNDNPNKIKYHLDAEESQIIFNGFKIYHTLSEEKIITIGENIDQNYINNPIYLSLNYLRNVLPKLIEEEGVSIKKGRDTTINKVELYSYTITLEKKAIHPFNYQVIESKNNSQYHLLIDRKKAFPYRITESNGENGTISQT